MVISLRKANSSVQGDVAVGLGKLSGSGVDVGPTGVPVCMMGWVGGAAFGGTKGVGVGVGEQADSNRDAKRMVNRPVTGLKRKG